MGKPINLLEQFSEGDRRLLDIIVRQEIIIRRLRIQNQEFAQEIMYPLAKPTIGFHNDPDWNEYDKHLKNNATAKAREVMHQMRLRYGLD